MFEIRSNKGRYVAVTLLGKVTESDYNRLAPFFEEKLREHRNLRVLFEFRDYEGMEHKARWEEFKMWLHHRDHFEKICFVGPKRVAEVHAWIVEIFSDSIIEFFAPEDIDAAWRWLHADESAEYASWATLPFTRVDKSEKD
ncbi:MAG: STAS/SEC14 domain-containing protein [Fimbriimonadaceae bacterium]